MIKNEGVKYMLIASFLFAVMNVIVKELKDIPVVQIVMMRSIVMLAIVGVMLKRRKVYPFGKRISWLVARGIFGTVGIAFFFYSVQHMPLASAVAVHYLTPIFTAFIAFFMVKERITWPQIAAYFLCLVGVYLIKGFDPRVEWVPLSIGVLGTLSAAMAYNIIHYLKEAEHHLVIMFYFPFVTIPLAMIFIAITGQWEWCSVEEWIGLTTIGVLTYFAQLFLTKAYQTGNVNRVSLVTYIGIIYAFVFGYYVSNETYKILAFSGILLIVIGVVTSLLVKPKSTPQ